MFRQALATAKPGRKRLFSNESKGDTVVFRRQDAEAGYVEISMNSFAVISATELESSAGATAVAEIVHGFSCGRNREVDNFVRSNGLEFTRRKISVTHFVFEPIRHRCVGYFTLTHKPLSMRVSNLSRTRCSRISRFARTLWHS